MMFSLKISVLICTAFLGELCKGEATKKQSKEELSIYRNSCLRLRSISKWLSVLLKLKSALLNTATNFKLNNPIFNSTKKFAAVAPPPKWRTADEDECSSLENFQMTFQSYVHFQARLLQLKAAFGNIKLHRALAKLNDSLEVKTHIRNLDILNRTTAFTIERLKQINVTAYLPSDDNVLSRNVRGGLTNAPKLLTYLQQQTNDILGALINIANRSDTLKHTQSMIRTGDLFQNIGKTLDNFFF